MVVAGGNGVPAPFRDEIARTIDDVISHGIHSSYCSNSEVAHRMSAPLLVVDCQKQTPMMIVSENFRVRSAGMEAEPDEVEICYGVVCSQPRGTTLDYVDVRLNDPLHIYFKFDMTRKPDAALVAAYHPGHRGEMIQMMNASRSFGTTDKRDLRHLYNLARMIKPL